MCAHCVCAYRLVCVCVCVHFRTNIIFETYTSSLMVSIDGWRGWGSLGVINTLAVVAVELLEELCWFTGASIILPLSTWKQTGSGLYIVEVEAVDARSTNAHSLATCFRLLELLRWNTHRPDSSSSLPTSQPSWHGSAIWAWLTGGLFVFPFLDGVHFLCSLCFRL